LIYEKLPRFILEKTWDKKAILPKTYKLQSNDPCNKVKTKVHQDSEKLCIKFTADKTIPEFKVGAKLINLDWSHSFAEFENVLQGQYKTAWKQILHKNFLERADPVIVPKEQDCLRAESFPCAMELFIKKALHKKKPPDCQYIYMMPGGMSRKVGKEPINHLH
jgi:hypothetical protein